MLQLESSWHGRRVDHVLTYSGQQMRSDHRKLHELRGKRLAAQVSETRQFALYLQIRVVLMLQLESSWHGRSVDQSGFDAPIGVVLAWESGFDAPIRVVTAWEERGSCHNIFRTRNCCRISETFSNYGAKDLLRKNLHELRGKTLVAKVTETRRFALYLRTGVALMLQLECHGMSGFDAQIGVVMAWEERGSCLNIFQMKIVVGSRKPSRITRQKTCCASELNMSVRFVFANRSGFDAGIGVIMPWEDRGSCINIFWRTYRGKRHVAQSGFDAPIGVVMAWEERGSCLNISRTTNRGQISETFTNYEAKDLLRKGFDAPIGVVMAWEERGSCLNIFRTRNCCRIFEKFTNYKAKDLLRKSVDHVLTYSGQQIAVGSQKASRMTRQKTCCASELNTSICFVFANRSGFDAPIGVFMAWEERGSCLNIFQKTNHDRISETFTNYEAKHLLRM
ncbi:uncharacterized protein G2W53_044792 [Senna tora]|uniref:Uncharacterized protein n=1 Tax=Senna tora TaxID=362788 RepID=A0A834SBQ1_9FABA|nr:uncharacterized protein G2W53_044792 [Senna tora]